MNYHRGRYYFLVQVCGQRVNFAGGTDETAALLFRDRIKRLIRARKTGADLSAELAGWLERLDPVNRDKLASVGLCTAHPHTVVRREQERLAAEAAQAEADWQAAEKARLEDEAREQQRIAAEAEAAEAARARRVTVAQICEEWLKDRHCSPSELVHRPVIKMIIEFFGADTAVEDVTEFDGRRFREFVKHKTVSGYFPSEKTIAPATQKNLWGYARSVFAQAAARGHITHSPLRFLHVSGGRNRAKDKYVTREYVQELILHARDPIHRLAFALARYGGLRCPSELDGIRWESFDWMGSTILVRATKTAHHHDESRLLPLWPEIADQVAAVKHRSPSAPRDYLFGHWLRSKPADALWDWYQLALRRARLERIPRFWVNCRASAEHDFLSQGHSITLVASWMGHAPLVALTHYTRIRNLDSTKAAVAAYLNRGWSDDAASG